jgi:hypothetical protein
VLLCGQGPSIHYDAIQLTQNTLENRNEFTTDACDVYLPAVSIQQPDTKTLFQLANLNGQGGLGNMQKCRRARKAFQVRD